jgi:hypothetical protein
MLHFTILSVYMLHFKCLCYILSVYMLHFKCLYVTSYYIILYTILFYKCVK